MDERGTGQQLTLRRTTAAWSAVVLLSAGLATAAEAATAGRPGAPSPRAATARPGGTAAPTGAARATAAATSTDSTDTTTTTTTVTTTTITNATTPATASTAGRGPCRPNYGPMLSVPVTVTGSGTATTATWWHNGDTAALRYWVGVRPASGTPQDRATTYWTRVVPPAARCQVLSVRLPGVQAGGRYVMWLDLESKTPETQAGITRRTLKTISVNA